MNMRWMSSSMQLYQKYAPNSIRQYGPGVSVVVAKDRLHWNSTASISCDRAGGFNFLPRNCVPSLVSYLASSRVQGAKSHLRPHHPHRPSHRSAFHTGSRQNKMPNRRLLQGFFDTNGKWADAVSHHDSSFFQTSAEGQKPKVLWIGCADSRVPESVLMACKPGEVFVHRNIAK